LWGGGGQPEERSRIPGVFFLLELKVEFSIASRHKVYTGGGGKKTQSMGITKKRYHWMKFRTSPSGDVNRKGNPSPYLGGWTQGL